MSTTIQDVLFCVVPFLTVNEATNASTASRSCLDTVREQKQPTALALVREELGPLKIGYENISDEEEGDAPEMAVYQVQNFRFKIRTPLQEAPVEIHVKLSNLVWIERGNRHILIISPGETRLKVVIYRGYHDAFFVGYHKGHTVCDCNKQGCFYCGNWRVDGFETNEEVEGLTVPPEHQANVRLALLCFYKCAKRIENWPEGGPWPTAEYLMRLLHHSLHPYFPEVFDWTLPHGDRSTKVELVYRQAPDLQEWRDYVPPPHCSFEYTLDELPWYGTLHLAMTFQRQLDQVTKCFETRIGHLEQDNQSLKKEVKELKEEHRKSSTAQQNDDYAPGPAKKKRRTSYCVIS